MLIFVEPRGSVFGIYYFYKFPRNRVLFRFFLATLKFGSARDLGMFPKEEALRMPVLTQKADSECINFHRLIKQKDYFLESSARVPVNTETHERPKLYNVAQIKTLRSFVVWM